MSSDEQEILQKSNCLENNAGRFDKEDDFWLINCEESKFSLEVGLALPIF